MYDYGWRSYMPDLGRWIHVDPLAEATSSFSPYAYAMNNPIKYIDPTGMVAEDCLNCGKPTQLNEAKYGSDGKYYTATPTSEGSNNLEWVRTSSISEVNIKPSTEAQANYNRIQAESRLHDAYENTRIGREISAVERFLFLDIPITVATAGAGGFGLSTKLSEVTVGKFFAKAGADAFIQLAIQKGDYNKVNITQSALAGIGMNYSGNAVISNAVNINKKGINSIYTGDVSTGQYLSQTGLGILGGTGANFITNLPAFKGLVIGSYMHTTIRFGQTAGSVVGWGLIYSPEYFTGAATNLP